MYGGLVAVSPRHVQGAANRPNRLVKTPLLGICGREDIEDRDFEHRGRPRPSRIQFARGHALGELYRFDAVAHFRVGISRQNPGQIVGSQPIVGVNTPRLAEHGDGCGALAAGCQ